ncbi:hypothetical protein [Labrys sp. (in: a-proteobacteria)]|uniref:hypothetical protein n=1 Tax=Labrys sp. (in: a-proteobacteria) TaxID=1917972 RepID=UPI0039E6C9D4
MADHDTHRLFQDAVARFNRLTGQRAAPEFLAAVRETAAREDLPAGYAEAVTWTFQEARKLWQERMESGAAAPDEEAAFAAHVASQFVNGRFIGSPAAHTDPAPAAASLQPPAPVETKPAAPARPGASTVMSSEAAKALAAIGRTGREPEAQQPHPTEAEAGWSNAIAGIAARMPGAKIPADGHDGKSADYFRSNMDAAPAGNVETKMPQPTPSMVQAGWDRAIASVSPTVASTEPTAEGQAGGEGQKIAEGWGAAVRAQAGTVAEGYHGSTPKQ